MKKFRINLYFVDPMPVIFADKVEQLNKTTVKINDMIVIDFDEEILSISEIS